MPNGLFVGFATLDVIQVMGGLPEPNRKLVAQHSWLAAGGPAAVAAIAFAALGGRARLLTALGSSPAAELVRADLTGAGVEILDAAPPGFELAASVALIDSGSGDRAVVSGSSHRPETYLMPELDAGGVDVVLLDGHHADLARAATTAVTGLPVVADAGSHKPVFDELWPQVTDVLCSAEYRHPSGIEPAALLAFGPKLVAVSHGERPLQLWTPTISGQVPVSQRWDTGTVPVSHTELPVPQVEAVDTLGAGDVLHGAYCFALARGNSRPQALKFAIAAATRRVTLLGPFAWREALRS